MTEIIQSITDLKKHIAIDFIAGFDVLEFAVEDREQELKKKYIGDALWANLIKSYDGTFQDANPEIVTLHTKALWYCQRVVSNFSLLDYIPEGQLDISANGIRITTSENKKNAFPWQIKNLEDKYRTTAERNLELLLQLFNENLLLFVDWTSSPAYVANKGNLINSAREFNTYININNSHLKFLRILPVMSYVEDFYMRSVLGDAFYEELLERIKDGEDMDALPADPTAAVIAAEYDNVFALVKGAITHFTGFEASNEIGCDKDLCEKKAAHYMQRLIEYLNNIASATLFNNYFTSSKYTAPVDDIPYKAGEGIDNSQFSGVFGAF